MKIRVYYEDTDIGGVVYHSNYLNFCERARSELFFAKGKTPILEEGHFVASTLEAKFLKPAKFADVLHVTTKLLKLKTASFILEQKIYRDEELLFTMNITLAHLDHDGKLSKMGEAVRTMLLELIDT